MEEVTISGVGQFEGGGAAISLVKYEGGLVSVSILFPDRENRVCTYDGPGAVLYACSLAAYEAAQFLRRHFSELGSICTKWNFSSGDRMEAIYVLFKIRAMTQAASQFFAEAKEKLNCDFPGYDRLLSIADQIGDEILENENWRPSKKDLTGISKALGQLGPITAWASKQMQEAYRSGGGPVFWAHSTDPVRKK